MQSRTTIVASDFLIKRVAEYAESHGITMSAFFNRAILNQLEKEGDFEVRDLYFSSLQDQEDKFKSSQIGGKNE